jgi:hypothetical protein
VLVFAGQKTSFYWYDKNRNRAIAKNLAKCAAKQHLLDQPMTTGPHHQRIVTPCSRMMQDALLCIARFNDHLAQQEAAGGHARRDFTAEFLEPRADALLELTFAFLPKFFDAGVPEKGGQKQVGIGRQLAEHVQHR